MEKFLFVDDHSMVRAGLITILSSAYPSAEYFEAQNEKQAVALINKHTFSLIVMDINMPDSDSARLLLHSLSMQPATPVLILSMNDERSFATRYFKLGVKGFLHKSVDAGEILNAVRVLLGKGLYMSDTLKESLLNSFVNHKADNPFESLSEREFQVVYGLITGKSIAEIAQAQGINISTVSTYKGKAYEKLGIPRSNFVELLSLAKLYNIG